MTKFGKSEKSDYPVCYFGTYSSSSFRIKPTRKLNLKI
jgi:hypothetical protein